MHTRHLLPKMYALRHGLKNKDYAMEHIAGDANCADILTKMLPVSIFLKHVHDIMGHGMIKFKLPGLVVLPELKG